jgi:hypothetical protein
MKTKFALFLWIIFVVAAVSGWDWPNIAKIMPVYVAAIPGFIMVSIQLVREMTGWETSKNTAGMDMDQVSDSQLDKVTERRRTLVFFAWFIGGALGIWLLGIVITLPLLVFSLRARRRRRTMVYLADYRRLRLRTHLGSVRIHVGDPLAAGTSFRLVSVRYDNSSSNGGG